MYLSINNNFASGWQFIYKDRAGREHDITIQRDFDDCLDLIWLDFDLNHHVVFESLEDYADCDYIKALTLLNDLVKFMPNYFFNVNDKDEFIRLHILADDNCEQQYVINTLRLERDNEASDNLYDNEYYRYDIKL